MFHPGLTKSKHVDMLHGPLFGKIFRFSLPLIASGVLQQSFTAVDTAVVGRYASTQAIAAVGSNGPIISILVNLFLGIAVGANAVIANSLGAKDDEAVRKSVSTVSVVTVVSGILLTILGVALARPILEAMSAPHDVIDLAETYLRIFFLGMPFMMIYNFGSAIMRSVGDTTLPFVSLLIATICNLILDVTFMSVFSSGVEAVAWATVLSNAINAGIIVAFLRREKEPLRLDLTRWGVSAEYLGKMLRIGVPAGMQGMVFSLSNLFIQSAINGFGSAAVAGSAAAVTFEAYCYYIVSAFCAATIAFAGQNYGAGLYDRCRRIFRICMLYSVVLCGLSNLLIALNEHACVSLFTTDPEAMRFAYIRIHTVLMVQCVASSYEISGAYMRAFGYSVLPMLLTVFGTCVLRVAWVAVFARIDHTFHNLLIIYPVTWTVTGILVLTAARIVSRRTFRPHPA